MPYPDDPGRAAPLRGGLHRGLEGMQQAAGAVEELGGAEGELLNRGGAQE